MGNRDNSLDKKMTKLLGQKLKSLREYKGYSLQYVADRMLLSKSRSTIQHWEAGRAQPNLSQLKQITEIYGIDVLDFLTTLYKEVYEK